MKSSRKPLRIAAIFAVVVSMAVVPYAAGFRFVSVASAASVDSCGYDPTVSPHIFNENDVTRWADANTYANPAQDTVSVFTNDETGLTLGVNGASPDPTSPAHLSNPNLGDGQAVDNFTTPRHEYPSLYITDITGSFSTAGDWEANNVRQPDNTNPAATDSQGHTPKPFADDIFGTWATATYTSGNTKFTTVQLAPAKNNWNLGAGADTPKPRQAFDASTTLGSKTITSASAAFNSADVGKPISDTAGAIKAGTVVSAVTSGTTATMSNAALSSQTNDTINVGATSFANLKDEGYGNEVRWNALGLRDYTGQALHQGHRYRIQVITHDADQNHAGGDVGEFCTTIVIPGPPGVKTSPAPGQTPLDTFHIRQPSGSDLSDTFQATDTGLGTPTGSVTYHLYFVPEDFDATNATANNCSGLAADHSTLVFSQQKDLVNGMATSSTYTDPGTGLGTYFWQDDYSPTNVAGTHTDPNYTATSEICGKETVEMIVARMLLSPPEASNAAGTPHVLTATLQTSEDGTTWASGGMDPSNPTTITFSFVGAHQASFVGGVNTCTADTTTGSCTATINSSAAETVFIHAKATNVQFGGIVGTFAVVETNSNNAGAANQTGDAIKHYFTARMLLSPPVAVNIVNNVHTLTATLQSSDDGSTWGGTVSSATTVTMSFVGAHSANAQFVNGQNTCSIPAHQNSCNVQIIDSQAETLQIHAKSVNVGFDGINGTFAVVETDSNNAGAADKTGDALKTYINPKTKLSVKDTLTGLTANAQGTVSYTAYHNAGDCASGQNGVAEGSGNVVNGTADASATIDIGPQNGTFGTQVFWTATFNGTIGGISQTFTSPCNEEASSS